MFDIFVIKRRLKSKSNDLRVSNKITNFWIPFSMMLPAIIFIVLFTVIPLMMALQDSIQKPTNFNNYYQNLWTDNVWLASVGNSFLFAIVDLPMTMILSLIIATSMATLIRKKARSFWQTVFFLPYVTSAVAVSITFAYLLNSQFGIINKIFNICVPWLVTPFQEGKNGLWAMIIHGVWSGLAFKVMILTTAMLSVDKTLYDSASVDGASNTKQFFKITLPAIERTIWYLITVGLIGSIKVFPIALFGNSAIDAQKYGPTMLGYVYKEVKYANYGLAGAASVMVLVLTLFFNVFVRVFMKGLQRSQSMIITKIRTTKIENRTRQIKLEVGDEND